VIRKRCRFHFAITSARCGAVAGDRADELSDAYMMKVARATSRDHPFYDRRAGRHTGAKRWKAVSMAHPPESFRGTVTPPSAACPIW